MCAIDEPLCSPRHCPPLQPSLLSALLLSGWKGLIQPTASLELLGSGFPPGTLSSVPELPHARVQPVPMLGRGSSLLRFLLLAFILLLPRGQWHPCCVPVVPDGRAGMGKHLAKPAPCPCSWREKQSSPWSARAMLEALLVQRAIWKNLYFPLVATRIRDTFF